MLVPVKALYSPLWKDLTSRAKRIAPFLMLFANNNGEFWPSVSTLEEIAGMDKRTVRDAFKDLQVGRMVQILSAEQGKSKVYRFTSEFLQICTSFLKKGVANSNSEVEQFCENGSNKTDPLINNKNIPVINHQPVGDAELLFTEARRDIGLTYEEFKELHSSYETTEVLEVIDDYASHIKQHGRKSKNPFEAIKKWIDHRGLKKKEAESFTPLFENMPNPTTTELQNKYPTFQDLTEQEKIEYRQCVNELRRTFSKGLSL